mgnify:CR=1 FL=1
MAPLVAIVGPTGSGKTALAVGLAHKYGGEIICADSRTIYKGMDIGTAKPTPAEQKQAKHHLLDIVTPDQHYSAAQFQSDAKEVIKVVRARKKLPIVVGGSGLYMDGLLYDFTFAATQPEVRAQLQDATLEKLQNVASELGIEVSSQTLQNPRHMQRAIERAGMPVSRKKLPDHCLVVGLRVEKEVLDLRIEQRVGTMLKDGLIKEVEELCTLYGPDAPGLLAPGYKALIEHIQGNMSFEEAKALFIRSHKQLAKRQMTWFKRSKDIYWADTQKEAEQIVETFLSKFATILT